MPNACEKEEVLKLSKKGLRKQHKRIWNRLLHNKKYRSKKAIVITQK